jgi:hypothetical protein
MGKLFLNALFYYFYNSDIPTMEKNPENKTLVKYHVYTLVSQIVLMFDMLVIMKLIERGKVPVPLVAGIVFQLLLLIVVHYMAFVTVKFYLKSNTHIIAYGIILFSGFLLLNIAGLTNDKALYIISNVLLLIAVLIWQYFIIKDIFQENHNLWYSIMAAANIYWLLIVVYGYCYSLMEISFPGMLGIQTSNVMEIFNASFRLSVHVMVGIDPPFNKMDEILSNFNLFQAATSNLYIIFIVGRLFSR